MVLTITVSDPETHTVSKVSAYVDFKVHTATDETTRFAAADFFVRRRYRDFLWLRGQLIAAYPGAIVPPLPPADKPYKGEFDRFSKEFIQRRQAGLELFLRRVAGHRMLASSADLLTFLEAKVWELQTAKNASKPSWSSTLLDSTDASMQRMAAALRTKTPDDESVERLRAFASEYYTVVTAAQQAHQNAVSNLGLTAADLSHLGPAFDLLSQSERELSLPFTHMAKELDALRDLHLQKEQAEHVSGLSALLAFNEGMAASLKDVLKNRDHALGQYNKATALLDSRSKEAQKWQLAQQASGGTPRAEAAESGGSGSGGVMGSLMRKFVDDPNKGQKLQSKVSEAERALEETKAKWDTISESLAQEAAEFHAITNADFAEGLREHALRQIAFEEEQQRKWNALLAVFEQVPASAV